MDRRHKQDGSTRSTDTGQVSLHYPEPSAFGGPIFAIPLLTPMQTAQSRPERRFVASILVRWTLRCSAIQRTLPCRRPTQSLPPSMRSRLRRNRRQRRLAAPNAERQVCASYREDEHARDSVQASRWGAPRPGFESSILGMAGIKPILEMLIGGVDALAREQDGSNALAYMQLEASTKMK